MCVCVCVLSQWTDKEVEMIVKHWRRIHGFTQFGWINDFHPIIRKYLWFMETQLTINNSQMNWKMSIPFEAKFVVTLGHWNILMCCIKMISFMVSKPPLTFVLFLFSLTKNIWIVFIIIFTISCGHSFLHKDVVSIK